MNITLTALTVPTSPVANRSASQVIFDNDYAILAEQPLKFKMVIALLGVIHAVSGTVDYRTAHKQVREDARVFQAGISTPMDQWAALAAKAWTWGNAVDGLSADINTLLAEARHLTEMSEEEIARTFLFVLLSKT